MTEQNGLERSSATERPRALLDERGVEHDDSFGATAFHGDCDSAVVAFNSKKKDAILYVNAYLTPEQAVKATLERETCEILGYDDGYDEGLDGEMYQYADPRYFLSCEHEAYGSVVPNYCPVCGRKVVDE